MIAAGAAVERFGAAPLLATAALILAALTALAWRGRALHGLDGDGRE